MEKRKNWQLYLIIAVFVITIYNILPTIFYYSKPLKEPIDAERAKGVAESIVSRVNDLEDESVEWIYSFSKNLGFKPVSVEVIKDDPQLITVSLANAHDAKLFRHFFPKAGTLIPFAPAQLELRNADPGDEGGNTLIVSRQIPVRFNPKETDKYFHYTSKYTAEHQIAQAYQGIIDDRVGEIMLAFAGVSPKAATLGLIVDNAASERFDESAIALAGEIAETSNALGKSSSILARWFASFSQSNRADAKELPQKYLARLKIINKQLGDSAAALDKEVKSAKQDGKFINSQKEETLALYTSQLKVINEAISILEKNMTSFSSGLQPLTKEQVGKILVESFNKVGKDNLQEVSIEKRNPFIENFLIDWDNDRLVVQFYDDIQKIRTGDSFTEANAYLQEKVNQLIINNISQASSIVEENFSTSGDSFALKFNNLTSTLSVLVFDIGYLAKIQSSQLVDQLRTQWNPMHSDLVAENYPISDFEAFQKLGSADQRLGLVVYAPSLSEEEPAEGFKKSSIYVIARGLGSIENKYKQYPNSPENAALVKDVQKLKEILQSNGYIGYSGNTYGIDLAYKNDYIFEYDDYYGNVLKATRENFYVKGSKTKAVLDMTDVEQRLLTINSIDDRIQEDLLKWKEEYNQAHISRDSSMKYMIPPPTKNAFVENLKLSFVKYFRGDENKVLKWGLDLSGGKTVRIGLRDQNNKPVTAPEDLRQAVNELYERVNKMGVSERTIRIENDNIILDFPGSQGLSAAELVKASAMYFNIINEKFSPYNKTLSNSINEFLQNVWNEAVVTNRKDVESINQIAWEHLGGDLNNNEIYPRTEIAKLLYENGLRFESPKDSSKSHAFNDAVSAVAVLRGDDFSEWSGQSHPLVVVFHNYALEGSSLTGVQVGYDPSEGNVLSFQVKNSYEHGDGSPRSDFYAWTSQFAQDQIKGTPKEQYTNGRGWRMAVILNNRIVSMPALKAALRDGGTISGNFTQREIDQLASDLKAGSLSFTPHILSEQNVSPELGKEERTRGIVASVLALILVVVVMIGYYRFGGVVASCAVLFNLLIMWGVLQNLGAALTLPGIAGVVLTIGMAVDANVLVFERFREEFKISGRIASAMQAGYRKAFNAIVDSNVTTIIAALILLQFDSGPIKGFAVTLIIGIVSSMFTALFMTRYFFAGWVQNPNNKSLAFSELIGKSNFDFLAQTKKAFTISLILFAASAFLFISQKNTMFGMDFTGGYSLTVEVQDQPGQTDSYRVRVTEALINAGASRNDVDVRELSRPTQLRIQLGTGLEEEGSPFYEMPMELSTKDVTFLYQGNPRLIWLVNALEKANIIIPNSQLGQLDKNWTVMSGQFSDSMRNNALIALTLALASIWVYITLRFEFKYAIAAVLGLGHDLILTLGTIALFHKLGFSIQINLEIIGALLTIIGYSLNDTIIVFDRIREDFRLYRKLSVPEIINHALNVTLSRTIMTSFTTLVVLFTLVLFGGEAIFGFSLVMTVGVFVGTLSSLFIASPIMLFFHNREMKTLESSAAKPRSA